MLAASSRDESIEGETSVRNRLEQYDDTLTAEQLDELTYFKIANRYDKISNI